MSFSSKDHPILSHLLSNNQRWADDIKRIGPEFFERLATGQTPHVLWIGCSDSRVPESVICAVLPGEIFVTRNIANQFHLNDDSADSVLAYAVDHVGVQHVIVSGHTHCGGVQAALERASPNSTEAPSSERSETALDRWITPLVDLAKFLINRDGSTDLLTLTNENVKAQVENVCNSPTIQEAWKVGKKSLRSWLGVRDREWEAKGFVYQSRT